LSVLAKLAGAKAVVEVGTGAGVSGLWLLSGMRTDGVLTTIDVEPEISDWPSRRSSRRASGRRGPG
jgi:predicted O-methyltransferase YrrM